MTATQPTKPRNRHRALAELDAEIDRAERIRVKCVLDVENTAASSGNTRRAQAMLNMAEERLSLLRNSRPVLMPGVSSLGHI
jgi:hypothetical protein